MLKLAARLSAGENALKALTVANNASMSIAYKKPGALNGPLLSENGPLIVVHCHILHSC